ncbi:MAG: hypothetical protein HOJ90_12435 [Alphaproteobacteria bacterium]|nr:hypothetical protein [Alphaproteobacteria bacterium]
MTLFNNMGGSGSIVSSGSPISGVQDPFRGAATWCPKALEDMVDDLLGAVLWGIF